MIWNINAYTGRKEYLVLIQVQCQLWEYFNLKRKTVFLIVRDRTYTPPFSLFWIRLLPDLIPAVKNSHTRHLFLNFKSDFFRIWFRRSTHATFFCVLNPTSSGSDSRALSEFESCQLLPAPLTLLTGRQWSSVAVTFYKTSNAMKRPRHDASVVDARGW